MNNKTKLITMFLLCISLTTASLFAQGTISGIVTDNTAGTGKYWVWVSTEPLGQPLVVLDNAGKSMMLLSSYTTITPP